MSDFTDTTISTWNQRHPPPTAEYPSVLSDRYRIIDRERINSIQRRLDFDTSNLMPRDPGPSYMDHNYRLQERLTSLSDQLTKVLTTGTGSSHINGSLADSGIQTDNPSTSVPHIYVSETQPHTTPVVFSPTPTKILRDASVDTRNENNLQDIPFIDDDDDESKIKKRRTNLLEKHKSTSNIPEKIDEVSSKEHSNERLSSSYNRAKSPTFVEKFKQFFKDIGLVRNSDNDVTIDDRETNTLPKTQHGSHRQQAHARSVSPNRTDTSRETSTLPKDMRFRKVQSSQTVYIRQESPLIGKKLADSAKMDHVSVVQVNGEETIDDSSSEQFIKEIVYVKSIEQAKIYASRDSGSTIIVVPPAD